MKRLRAIAIGLLILASLGAKAQSKDVYRSPKTSVWVGFNSGHYKQDGYPSLKSNIGGSVMLNSSFWIIKPGNQRFKLGIEAGWLDLNYYDYKVNMQTFEGGVYRYKFQQFDLGMQAGLCADYHITRDIRLHARACYNPAYSGIKVKDDLNYAFANYGTAGISISWKHFGVGFDVKFGKAKYKNIDYEEGDEGHIVEGDEMGSTVPGTINGGEKLPVKLTSLRTSIVFSF